MGNARDSQQLENIPKKYGPHGELFFFLIKEPVIPKEMVDFLGTAVLWRQRYRVPCVGLRMTGGMSSGTSSDEEYEE